MHACADGLIPVVIEAGGKDALLADADADIGAAADAAVWGGMSNAGQTCAGVERVYVHQQVYDAFVAEVTARARGLRAGPGQKIGPMTIPAQPGVVGRHIADALARGGSALVGGLDAVGERYVQPTVLTGVPEDSVAVTEETFGPTLTIAKVPDMDEAVRRANATPYGLGATVFSRAHGTTAGPPDPRRSNVAVKFDPRSRIRNLMLPNRSPRVRARLRACCTVHSPVGFAVTPPRCIRRLPCSMNTSTYSLFSSTVSTCRKSTARIPAVWACRNCRHVGPEWRCAGSMPAARRICHNGGRRECHAELGQFAVDPAVSPQRILLCQANDQAGDARDRRRAAGLAPLARVVLFAGQFAVPGRSVAGVTGKISVQRLRGIHRASAANHNRSAGSYRTRLASRRSIAFSCRSTSSSASFARSPRNTRTARPSTRHVST